MSGARLLCIRPYGHSNLLLGPINRSLEVCDSLLLLLALFLFTRLESES
jgi:hypothetical protein